jgi:hypothetical protein
MVFLALTAAGVMANAEHLIPAADQRFAEHLRALEVEEATKQ